LPESALVVDNNTANELPKLLENWDEQALLTFIETASLAEKNTISQKVVETLQKDTVQLKAIITAIQAMPTVPSDQLDSTQLMVATYALADSIAQMMGRLKICETLTNNSTSFYKKMNHARNFLFHDQTIVLYIVGSVSAAHISRKDNMLQMAIQINNCLIAWLNLMKESNKTLLIAPVSLENIDSPLWQKFLMTPAISNWELRFDQEKEIICLHDSPTIPLVLMENAKRFALKRRGIALTHYKITHPNIYKKQWQEQEVFRQWAKDSRHPGVRPGLTASFIRWTDIAEQIKGEAIHFPKPRLVSKPCGLFYGSEELVRAISLSLTNKSSTDQDSKNEKPTKVNTKINTKSDGVDSLTVHYYATEILSQTSSSSVLSSVPCYNSASSPLTRPSSSSLFSSVVQPPEVVSSLEPRVVSKEDVQEPEVNVEENGSIFSLSATGKD